MGSFRQIITILSILFFSLSPIANGQPIQYCKFGSAAGPGEKVDFCMGVLSYRNTSTNSHDMFLTMTVKRLGGSAAGWTAIGAGSTMRGSVMFIIYGDPLGKEQPVVSIRTVSGHHQPTLLTSPNLPHGMDIRIIRSSWLLDQSSSDTYIARISIVCYSCQHWSGADLSAQSKSQPWIWAWNSNQKFDNFTPDAHLTMHKHHAGKGGWGNFYIDMSRSVSTERYAPSLPPIRPNVAALGASDTPMTFTDSVFKVTIGPGSYFHGLILSTAFLLLFPLGVVSIRSGSSKSYTYHWIIQVSASVFLVIGVVVGLLKSSKINTFHQGIGITLVSIIGFQSILGSWHHVRFIRLRRRTWVSYAHIWSGRLVMTGGWVNIIGGLVFRGYKTNDPMFVFMVICVCCQAIGLGFWVHWIQEKSAKGNEKPSWARGDNTLFVLSTCEEEEEELVDNDGEETVNGVEEKTACFGEPNEV
jgi:hypothetical protein